MTKKITTIKQFRDGEATEQYQITLLVKRIYRTEQGLNLFTVSDGDEHIKFIAFVKGGMAYGEIQEGSVATFVVKQKHYEGELQGTVVDAYVTQDPEATLGLRKQLLLKEYEKAKPSKTDLLVETMDFEKLQPSLLNAATLIRGAVISRRPIIITHHADVDGYCAGILLERAIIAEVQAIQSDVRYLQNYVLRNPSKTPYYDLVDVTKDIAFFQLNQQRAGVAAPLIIIVDNGSTSQDVLSIKKAQIFGADVIVVDHHDPGVADEEGKTEVCKHTLAHVNPHLVGISKDISASMLCYQLAFYVDQTSQPSVDLAALGGVTDKCEGSSIEQLIKTSKKKKEFFQTLGRCVDFEIYHTKFNHTTGSLFALLEGEKQEALMQLYQPLLDEKQEQIRTCATHYCVQEQHGDFSVALLDGESTTLWGDYFSIGKFAAVLHAEFADKPNHVTIIYSNNIIVFRAQQTSEHSFDVNELLAELEGEFEYSRIDGGGHAVAGSLRFVFAAREAILQRVKAYIATC